MRKKRRTSRQGPLRIVLLLAVLVVAGLAIWTSIEFDGQITWNNFVRTVEIGRAHV